MKTAQRCAINVTLSVAALAAATSASAAAATYANVISQLHTMQAANPTMTEMFSIGQNDQGTEIQGLRIGNPASTDGTHFLVVGTHHGNEQKSVDIAMEFIRQRLADPSLALSGDTYFVIPVLNVTGYNANRREESYRGGGTLDSNRDYPDPCGNDTPFQLKSTKALADFLETESIDAAVTIHGYVGSFTYPWGTYTDDSHTLDQDTFDALGRAAVRENGYETGTHGDVIYPTVGAFEDWAYYEHGIWSMLIEIENNPNAGNDARALGKFFSQVPRERSQHHEHLGHCRVQRARVLSRP